MKQNNGIIKVGGISLIISGILFFVQYLFILPLPAPPPVDAELMAWLADWRFNIAMADEVFFFATLLMIPSIAALYSYHTECCHHHIEFRSKKKCAWKACSKFWISGRNI
ncbi:hypothetical protein [Ruminiclostridium cellobioparum]|uniref:hypothetical protein n=1 Tax=Ruminiclostridium cellobioparum TaxID=29355 RepID=UPI000480A5FE|nr:hypothetical protein [Ruminiclostridium cellobioparum]